MDAIILARVSSKEQEENYSIPSQVYRLQEYCKEKNLNVIETVSLVESSTRGNRAKFKAVLTTIRRKKAPVALVADTIDRVQRGFSETTPLLELAKSGRLEIHFYRERLVINQYSTNTDLMRWDFGALQAKSYVTQLSDNVKRGQEEKLRNGEWLSKAPFGYRNIRQEDGKTWIVPDENAPIVKKMFQCYATGVCSVQEITKLVRETYGIRRSVSKTHELLRNPFYYGVMVVKGKRYAHKYQPIISKELYDAVQEVLDSFHKSHAIYAGKEFVYRSMLTCKECGCHITAEEHKGHIYYHCTQHKGKHGAKWVREERITEQIEQVLRSISPSESEYQLIMENLRSTFAADNELRKKLETNLQNRITANQTKNSRLLDKLLEGAIDDELYKAKSAELKSERATLENSLLQLASIDQDWFTDISEVISLAKDAPLLFAKSSKIVEKRQLLKLLFSNLQISGTSLCYKMKKPFNRRGFSTYSNFGWG